MKTCAFLNELRGTGLLKIITIHQSQNMSQNRYNWDERFRYWLDSFMSKGGTSVFLSLLFLFFVAFVVMGTLRFVVFLIFLMNQLRMGPSCYGTRSFRLSILAP